MNIDTSVVGITIPQGAVKNIKRGTEMLWQDGGLPTAFQRCEYIESHGTEYIDTGVLLSNNHTAIIDIETTSDSGAGGSFGWGEGSPFFPAFQLYSNANSNEFSFRYATTANVFTYYSAKLADLSRHTWTLVPEKLYRDGVLVGEKSVTSLDWTATGSAFLFASRRRNGSVFIGAGFAVWSCIILENNGKIRDYVPCYLKTAWNGIPAGTIGLYDLCGSICPLTNTPFYINASTGAFTKGADVV